jgi:hypothetical protein
MFQYFATFLKDVSPLSIASMASYNCWYVHLARFEVSTCLYLLLFQPFIIVVARWQLLCYVNGWYYLLTLQCCWFGKLEMLISWSSQWVFEILFHYFIGTLRCDGVQFVRGAPLVYIAIGTLIALADSP